MSDMNQCNFIGRLGRDPDVRATTSGNTVATLALAVGEKWKDKQTGEKKEHTEWIKVTLFGRMAEIARDYTQKGSRLRITGKMRTTKYQDQSGQDKYSTDIVANEMQLLDTKQQGQQQAAPQQQAQAPQQAPQQQAQPQAAPMDDFDDDIPFMRLQHEHVI